MISLDIRVDTTAINAQLRALGDEIESKIIPRALNRTAITVRAVAAREIASDLGGSLKIAEIKKALWIVRARSGDPVAIVRASGRKRIPLGAFKTLKETATGVSVKIGTKTYSIPHAFLLKQGRAGTWLASTRDRRRVRIRAPGFKPQIVDEISFRPKRVRRIGLDFPIAALYGPGVPFVFIQPRVVAAIRKVAPEKFAQVIAQEIRFRG